MASYFVSLHRMQNLQFQDAFVKVDEGKQVVTVHTLTGGERVIPIESVEEVEVNGTTTIFPKALAVQGLRGLFGKIAGAVTGTTDPGNTWVGSVRVKMRS